MTLLTPPGVGLVGFPAAGGTFLFSLASSYDPDAAAFFAAQVAAGQTLSTTQKNAVNQLVLDEKAAGIWSLITVQYPFLGNSAACDAINLSNPTANTITWHGTVTHTANGITGDGSTGYGDTGLSVAANNDDHSVVYLRDSAAANSVVPFGIFNTSIGYYGIYGPDSSNSGNVFSNFYFFNCSGLPVGAFGYLFAGRTSSSFCEVRQNSTQLGSSATPSVITGAYTGTCFVSAINSNGTAGNFAPFNCAFLSSGRGLTSAQSDAFHTAVQKFQTTLSRQV